MTAIKLNKAQTIELKALAAFGDNGDFWPVKDATKFDKLGVVQVAPTVTNEAGDVAIRINEAGKAYLASLEENVEQGVDTGAANAQNANQQDAQSVEQPKAKPGVKQVSQFAIESNIALPTVSARASNSVYPFDLLEVGQSFFVPATEDKPEPHVSLASTVASANKRHAVEIPGQTRVDRKQNVVPATYQARKFVVRKDTKDGVTGARVFRVEGETAPTAEAAE